MVAKCKWIRTMENKDKDNFYAAGFGGNFIIVEHNENLLIVTAGWNLSKRIRTGNL